MWLCGDQLENGNSLFYIDYGVQENVFYLFINHKLCYVVIFMWVCLMYKLLYNYYNTSSLLFILYTTPLSHLIESSFVDHHLYADNTQLFVSFFPVSYSTLLPLLSSLMPLFTILVLLLILFLFLLITSETPPASCTHSRIKNCLCSWRFYIS